MTKRIPVVKVQEYLRGVLRNLLAGSGYAVIEPADGQDGILKAKMLDGQCGKGDVKCID